MADIQTVYSPGSMSTITQAPPPVATHTSELAEFYRELLRRKAQALQNPRPAAQPATREYSGGPAGGGPMPVQGGGLDSVDPLEAAKRQDAMQELAYRQRLRQIDLAPPKKLITGGPGITPGWAEDVTLLPLSMRPQASHIAYGPQDEAKAQLRYGREVSDDQRMAQQRQNSYYGR